MHTVRVHTGADDSAYNCMGWGPDQAGVNGVFLRKDVPLQVCAQWQCSTRPTSSNCLLELLASLTSACALLLVLLMVIGPQAARALEACLRTIAPRIMTWGQYAEAATNLFAKAVLGQDMPEFVPDWTRCADHFALHAGEQPQGGGLCADAAGA
jgi:hypothetical protein